jgi:hypothetical protein
MEHSVIDQAPAILVNAIPKEHRWKIRLFQGWHHVIGQLGDKVRIEKIYNNTLVLGVSHPSWAQELLMLSSILRKKVNDVLEEDRIKTIRFSSASFRTPPVKHDTTASSHRTCVASQPPLQPLNDEERAHLATIPNEELRCALEHFYVHCKRRRHNCISART